MADYYFDEETIRSLDERLNALATLKRLHDIGVDIEGFVFELDSSYGYDLNGNFCNDILEQLFDHFGATIIQMYVEVCDDGSHIWHDEEAKVKDSFEDGVRVIWDEPLIRRYINEYGCNDELKSKLEMITDAEQLYLSDFEAKAYVDGFAIIIETQSWYHFWEIEEIVSCIIDVRNYCSQKLSDLKVNTEVA